MLYTATVTGVTGRTVTRKKDNKTITIYEVTDSAGNTNATSRRDIANEANRLLNQVAEFQVRVEQNGSYENRYLDDIKAATGAPQPGGLPAPPPPQQEVVVRQEAIPVQQAAVSPPRTDDPAIKHEGEGTQKDWSIWRQTSTKVAVHLSATPQEFWFNVRQLMTFYATGLEPDLPQAGVTSYATQTQPSPAAQAQNAQQNQFIPDSAIEGDPGPAGGWPSDDDIPFAPTF